MDTQPLVSDARLEHLEDLVIDLARRVDALERAAAHGPASAPVKDEPELAKARQVTAAQGAGGRADLAGVATLVGRTFIVCGGAFLVRALTASGRVTPLMGVTLGLVYAAVWLVAAHRAAKASHLSASFHGVAALIVAFPLIWEATVRFGIMGAGASAFLLAVVAAFALTLAWRDGLDSVTGSTMVAAVMVAVATALASDRFVPFALIIIAVSAAAYWWAEPMERGWLRWFSATTAGVSVMAVTARTGALPPRESIAAALATTAFLMATMEGSLAVRSVILGRPARIFDFAQAFFALLIGVGGAAYVVRHSPGGLVVVGLASGVLAAGGYLAAIYRLADRPHLAATYHASAALGLTAAVLALIVALDGDVLALASLAFAMIVLVFGYRRLVGDAALHGAAFVLVSVTASGLLGRALSVWTRPQQVWPVMDLTAWVTLVVAVGCVSLSRRGIAGIGDLLTRIGRLSMATVVVIGAGGAALMLVGPVVAGTPTDAGVLASTRTILLSVSAVGLALASRWRAIETFGLLVYPVLGLGAARLVIDDFRHSAPSTLFAALAVYGLALVLAPRLNQRAQLSA